MQRRVTRLDDAPTTPKRSWTESGTVVGIVSDIVMLLVKLGSILKGNYAHFISVMCVLKLVLQYYKPLFLLEPAGTDES